jgi:hypothetical protein
MAQALLELSGWCWDVRMPPPPCFLLVYMCSRSVLVEDLLQGGGHGLEWVVLEDYRRTEGPGGVCLGLIQSICVCVHRLSVSLSVCRVFIWLFVFLSICVFVYVLVCMAVCLFDWHAGMARATPTVSCWWVDCMLIVDSYDSYISFVDNYLDNAYLWLVYMQKCRQENSEWRRENDLASSMHAWYLLINIMFEIRIEQAAK